jgi:hypothetical protein
MTISGINHEEMDEETTTRIEHKIVKTPKEAKPENFSRFLC